jgi:hypothetical protein
MKLASITSIALLATILSACGGSPDFQNDPPVGTDSQCIINGNVVTEDTIGTPLLYGPGWNSYTPVDTHQSNSVVYSADGDTHNLQH